MNIIVKRFDKTLPFPSYKTPGAAAFDLYSRIDVNITAGGISYIPLNICIKIPKGYWAMLVARSSTHKLGIMQANGIGVLDQDFCGDSDEIQFAAYNFTDHNIKIEKATRIAQLLIIKGHPLVFTEVDSMLSESRGGFGTTGLK